jgi:hypothetical protein
VRSKIEYTSVVLFPSYNSHILLVESILRKFLKVLYFREDGVYPRIGLPQQLLLQRFEFNSCLERVECSSTIFVSKLLRNDIDAAPILSRLSFNVKIRATALRNRKIFYAPSVHTNVDLFSPINKLSSASNSVNVLRV